MLEIKGDKFFLNGEKFNIYSGAIHYFRTLPEYWEDRLTKLKLAGFNTVETYVCWNLHEPKPNQFDFEGLLDIVNFLKIAQKVGLYAIVRPGPYICAEWDFGGLPAWLLKDHNMRIRCNYPDYLDAVTRFYKELLTRVNTMQITNGGNVIAMQIENEYGSYGNDKEYLRFVEKLMVDCGVNVFLFTSDGNSHNCLSGGSLPNIYKVLNFGSGAKRAFKILEGDQDNAPKMCGEFWDGWFDHWGDKHHTRNHTSVVRELNDFLDDDCSFNFYMFHGGTNFNFWAGANHDKIYTPTVTSYDYSALLSESGGYTESYHAVREVLLKHQGLEPLPLPPEAIKQDIGEVKLTTSASLLNNLSILGEKHRSATPETMEYFGQNFGMIHYHTEYKGTYSISSLNVENVHDRAYIYIDGKLQLTYDRSEKRQKGLLNFFKRENKTCSLILPYSKEGGTIDILVDAMGRTNYGKEMYDRKGLTSVSIGNQILFGWDITTLPLDNIKKLKFSKEDISGSIFLKGTFTAQPNQDCFVHMDGFAKGVVYINGFNIGRHWKKGPQKTLYIPGVLLKESNEIIVLELESNNGGKLNSSVIINSTPDLG